MADKTPPDEPATNPAPVADETPDAEQGSDRPHKVDLVAEAITRGIPSYEAWALTIPELTERLET